ncbi:hypothetical protein ABN239_06145 [Providencia vermicola]|uniref:hypothetical protein n=1 Tax=Providencia vermicola TaxID=333965 RepID=UPI0032D9C41E
MSKLFKLKKWLTLNEVVNHLSNVLGESVTLSDIYKLALDGYLKLSIEFINGAKVKKVKIIKKEDIIYEKILPVGIPLISTGSYFSIPKNVVCPISNNHWIQAIDHKVISIKGTWDLAMIGAERADIENRYHKEISGHSVEIPLISGFYVMRDDIYYQLQILEKNIANTDDDLVPMEINLGGGIIYNKNET